MHYVAQIARERGRTLVAFPDCPGCQTFAESDEDVEAVAQEALEGWLEAHLVDGDAPPRPRTRARGSGALRIPIDPALAVRLQIRWARKEAGLSQGQLADRLGVTRQQVSLLESPYGDYKVSTLKKVSEALGLELEISLQH